MANHDGLGLLWLHFLCDDSPAFTEMCGQSGIIFKDQFLVSTMKLRRSFFKFMIPISLLEKFGSQSFVTSIEVSQMTRYSSKTNMLRNVNTIRRGRRNIAIQKWEINNVKIKIIAFAINFR